MQVHQAESCTVFGDQHQVLLLGTGQRDGVPLQQDSGQRSIKKKKNEVLAQNKDIVLTTCNYQDLVQRMTPVY